MTDETSQKSLDSYDKKTAGAEEAVDERDEDETLCDWFAVENEEVISRAVRTAMQYRQIIVQSPQTSHRPTITDKSDNSGGEEIVFESLAGRIIDAAGAYPGKYDPPVALSTHILNAIVTGVNSYVYDRIVRERGEADPGEAALLIAALALHDTNKFVDAAYDPDNLDTSENSEAVIDYYFQQGDPFAIEQFLDRNTEAAFEVDLADIKWLIQRTETKESSSETDGQSTSRVRGLEKYCRIGDGFVSKIGHDDIGAGAEWLEKFFSDAGAELAGQHVHLLEFSKIEQSILSNHLLATVKEIIEDPRDPAVEAPTHGLILGSTPDSVLYLGAHCDRDVLQDAVAEGVMNRVTDAHEFSAKTNWNAFEYDILAEIDIGFETKREIIADGYAEELARGAGTDHEFESVPDAYRDALPELAKAVFRDQDNREYETIFDGYSTLWELWQQVDNGDDYSVYSRKIGFLAELLRRHEGAVDDGFDTETVRQEVADFAADHREGLQDALTPETQAGAIATARFFEGGLQADMTVPSGDEMCFLCGRPAEREYKKGNDAFYKTQSFSRRVPAEGSYKRICSVCNLEHALLRDEIEGTGYSVGSDIKIAFIYYDEFVGELKIGDEGDPTRLVRQFYGGPDEDDQPAFSEPKLIAGSFIPQYHLQPFYADSENARLRVIRELLETVVTRGFKVTIGKPFAGFRPQDALLSDLNPTRRQTGFGADRITSFAELERTRRLFDILRKVAGSSDYSSGRELTSIQQDGFQPIANLVAQESERYETVRTLTHEHFSEQDYPDRNQYMMMRNVAQAGLDLYGREYTKYKKTKIFRLAIDGTLDALNREKTDDELHEYVAGQVYKTALEEDYTGRVTTGQAAAFVGQLVDYLREEGSFEKQALSKRRNALTNSYLFAYDQLLSELEDEGDEADDGATPEETESTAN